MSETDILDTETPGPPGHDGSEPHGFFRRVSERTPLRTKLLTAVLALVIMALAAISVASVVMLRGYVSTQHDTELQSALNVANRSNNLPLAGSAKPFAQGSEIVVGIQLPGKQLSWPSSTINPDFGGPAFNEPLPQLPTAKNWTGSHDALITTAAQTGPDSWRVLGEPVSDPNTGATATLIVAVPLGNVGAMTARLVLFDVVVGGAIVIVLAAVAIGVVRANLRPLNDIELTAGQIAAGHLEHRVPEGDPRTEIGSLGRSLNAMLSQIEQAFHAQEESEQAAHRSEERMRRFIADASHELRTPLTTIRGFAAHYRLRGGASQLRTGATVPGNAEAQNHSSRTDAGDSWRADYSPTDDGTTHSPAGNGTSHSPAGNGTADGLSPGELDHLMERVEAEATRMGFLVEDLLTLARLDQQRPLAKAPVDALTLAADAVQDARIVSPGRPIDLIVAPGTAFLVDGDEPRLRQVIANLVNNAITHTPAGTPVRVKIARGTLETRDTTGAAGQGDWGASAGTAGSGSAEAPAARPRAVPAVVLDVEDDGPGMTNDQAQRVFERFYRADAARNRASGGTGLGLAIVAGLVSAHGGTVSVRTSPGQGADFQVKLPLSPDALLVDEPDDDPSA